MICEYSVIGKAINLQANLSDLSDRAKCDLFNQLLKELELDVTNNEPFQLEWEKMMEKFW